MTNIKNPGFFSHLYKSIVEMNKNVTCPSKYISLYAHYPFYWPCKHAF